MVHLIWISSFTLILSMGQHLPTSNVFIEFKQLLKITISVHLQNDVINAYCIGIFTESVPVVFFVFKSLV